ncbi:MAG: hypothetical protein IJH20_03700 [Bacilli bacterium]|nr:hypothetical protein [Bacilli bacterium]
MNMIYSRDNIFKRLQSAKNYYKKVLDEDYFLIDIIYAFNNLTMNEQDFYLSYKVDSYNPSFEEEKAKLREINNKMRETILNGDYKVSDKISVVIKNPKFKSSKKNNNEKLDNKISDVKQGKILLNNGVIKLEDILDENFGKDEKELIYLKYSEVPPLSNSAVALRKGVDTDEVNETTNKLYKTAFETHKKLVLIRENFNERKC